ncbi:MAG TPA: DUF2231 domain-containing protein [Thermoanaerobaculia bacterium]|nr:DUF2231 domain-containing protein [Thermoanaerobaculia bacterium]
MSFLFDLIALFAGMPALSLAAWYMILAGIVSGLLAAVFGVMDYFTIPPRTRAKRVAMLHGAGNVVVLVLFAMSWLLRWDAPELANPIAIVISGAAFLLAGVTGWLGGELVNRLGVDRGANPDAPSSLSGRPAA